jgi:hypothetical protein
MGARRRCIEGSRRMCSVCNPANVGVKFDSIWPPSQVGTKDTSRPPGGTSTDYFAIRGGTNSTRRI